jgi:hypothetical protein
MHFIVLGIIAGIVIAMFSSKTNSLMPEEMKRERWAKMQWRKKYLHPIYNTLFFGSIIIGVLFWIGNR